MSRNADALESLYEDWLQSPEQHFGSFAAARGVLAVDSLTDEQAEDAWLAGGHFDTFRHPDRLRAALRRCATGEPPNGD